MMDKRYWDKLAKNFKHNVFEVFENDSRGVIEKTVKKYAKKSKIATDIGCGVGSLLPTLSQSFKKVYGVDISPKCLKQAKKNCGQHKNIDFIARDLAKKSSKLPETDFALYINALIFPSYLGRENFLSTTIKALNKNGILLLVVPSLESALLRNHREIQWNMKSGQSPAIANQVDFFGIKNINSQQLSLGIVNIDGVKTKHFLKEEIQLQLEQRGMNILQFKKLEYLWNTEFFDPPKWMQTPYPWDWFCLAKKS